MDMGLSGNFEPSIPVFKPNTGPRGKRLLSVDITRGLIVLFSVFTSAIPPGGYEQFRHPAWYGLTLFDFIFPTFLTLFGASLALAFRKGVPWKKFCLRTARLIIFGLLFNMIVNWNPDLHTLRLTGVLLLYAVLGLAAALITRLVRRWPSLLLLGLAVSVSYLALLLVASAGYPGGLPQPDFNLSGLVDAKIFGLPHMYFMGRRGYDPEGVLNMYSALANVLFGYAAGTILHAKKMFRSRHLLLIGLGLILGGCLFNTLLPFNKKIWTPSFALLTAGAAIAALGLAHAFFDHGLRWPRLIKGGLWYLEAFGRNSFLVYFGKMILLSLMGNITLSRIGIDRSISAFYLESIARLTVCHPGLIYALTFVVFWSAMVALLRYKKWYIKV